MQKCKLVLEYKEDKRIQPFKGLHHSFVHLSSKILCNYKMKTHGEYKDGFSNDLIKEALILMTTEICPSARRSFTFGSQPQNKNLKDKLRSLLK